MADQFKYSVDDQKFREAMLKYAVAKKKSFSETLIQGSRILAVNLAHQTQPFGSDNKAKESGEGAVTTEIQRAYKSPGNVFFVIENSGIAPGKKKTQNPAQAARVFVRYVKRGQLDLAEKLLHSLRISPFFSTEVKRFDQGKKHQSVRFGARRKVSRNQFPEMIPSDVGRLKSYINQIIKRVGTAKAGWASCAQQLGGMRGIPGWVTRHARAGVLGTVDDASFLDTKPYIRLTNTVPWVDKCLNQTQMQRAFDIASYKMMQFLRISLAKAEKSAGF